MPIAKKVEGDDKFFMEVSPNPNSSQPLPQQAHAGFLIRLAAYCLDVALVFCFSAWIGYAIAYAFQVSGLKPQLINKVFIQTETLVSWIIAFFYHSIFQAFLNGTFGKRALGLRLVQDQTYEPITLSQSVRRYFAWLIGIIPMGAGMIWCLFNEKKKSFHDQIAKTVVVYYDPLQAYHQQRNNRVLVVPKWQPSSEPSPQPSTKKAA